MILSHSLLKSVYPLLLRHRAFLIWLESLFHPSPGVHIAFKYVFWTICCCYNIFILLCYRHKQPILHILKIEPIQPFCRLLWNKFSVLQAYLLSFWFLEIYSHQTSRSPCDLSYCSLSPGQGTWRWWFGYRPWTAKKIASVAPVWVGTFRLPFVFHLETLIFSER